MKQKTLLGLLVIAAFLGMIIAMLPPVFAERRLAATVKGFAALGEPRGLPDGSIRTHVQQLARKQGFHLEFHDIFVEYDAVGTDVSLAQPRRIGYTLPLALPIMGIWEWRLVAARAYQVALPSDSQDSLEGTENP